MIVDCTDCTHHIYGDKPAEHLCTFSLSGDTWSEEWFKIEDVANATKCKFFDKLERVYVENKQWEQDVLAGVCG